MSRSALVIDDDPLSREFLAEALRTNGYQVQESPTGEDGVQAAGSREPDILLTDLRLPGIDGIEVLESVKARYPDLPVVVLTAYGTVERAVAAMRAGAEDFLLKPVSPEQLDVVLERITRRQKLVRENKALKANLDADASDGPTIIGESPAFQAAVSLAERVAGTDATVLVRGESGTGKEVIASVLHASSPRASGPMIRVNCAALTESLLTSELFGHDKGAFTGAHARKEGRFELAAGGTIFLDEIGEMPLEVQSRLLRVLESGEFERVGGTKTLKADCRVVAATNRDLETAIAEGRFREDLFYRLNVVPVVLPPLRDRRNDIPALSRHFIERFSVKHGSAARRISNAALERLAEYDWPGNVRELANVVQRALLVARGDFIEPDDLGLPRPTRPPEAQMSVGSTLEEMERTLILQTLEHTGWNRTRAARILGVTARTLSNKLKVWRARGFVSSET